MRHLAVIGGGNMGEALVSGLLRSRQWTPSQVTVTDIRTTRLKELHRRYGVRVTPDNRTAVGGADVILLAVKPQQMAEVLKGLAPVVRKAQTVLSIAAGIPTAFIEKRLVKGVPVVRIMPNTPALVGAGASALARGRWARRSHERLAARMLATVGTVVTVPERHLNAVTALSGSGPAYVFYLAEAMAEAGRQLGLPARVADALVRQTVRGSGRLLAQSADDPSELRRRVTSPGGTTEAAITVLEKAHVRRNVVQAIQRACRRASELSRLSKGGHS